MLQGNGNQYIQMVYLTLVSVAKIKTSSTNTYQQGCRIRRTLLHCWWECKLVQPLGNQFVGVLENWDYLYIKTQPTTPGHITKDGLSSHKYPCLAMFTAALFLIPETWKQPRLSSTEECIKKCSTPTMEYYSAIKSKTS
jgi:hypothetical protein